MEAITTVATGVADGMVAGTEGRLSTEVARITMVVTRMGIPTVTLTDIPIPQ